MKKKIASCLLVLLCVCMLQTGCKPKDTTTSSGTNSEQTGEFESIPSDNGTESEETEDPTASEEQSASTSGTSSKSSVNSNHTTTKPSASGQDIWKKYSPAITLKMVRSTDDIIENTLNQLGETIGSNRWLKLYQDKLGVNIKYDWVAKGNDGYATKLNLSIASKQLPDVFSVTPLQMQQLAAAGLIEDLTTVYQDYASTLTKQTMDEAGTDAFEAATIRGKLMGLPCTTDPSGDAPMLWIRKDWLDNLGLSVPKTMDELCNVIKRFTTDDPDKNGKADTFGFATYKGLWGTVSGLEGFFAGFHSYPRIWQEDASGNLAYGAIQPEAKAALKKLNELYKSGYMPIDFGVYDAGVITELITSGKVGIQYGSHWNSVWPLNLCKEKDSKANWIALPLLSADNKPAKSTFVMAASSWFVVKKGYKNPEALVKIFNTFIDTNWGENNQWNKYYLDGKVEGVWKLSPIFPSVTDQNIQDYKQLEQARQTNDYSKLGGSAKGIQAMLDAKDWGWTAVYGSGGSMGVLQGYKEGKKYVKDKFVTAPTPTMVTKLNTLSQMQNETYVKIIMGSAPLSEFDTFVANWKKAGGDKMTKEVNEWYKSTKR